ncbi:MAG: DNA double-strand break repair nuclease NurA, partial [Candidatus Aenigmarchaeota archaeon]|nr:DNA double-strand break repair nuclease NurA [Candidatus Aenigmarchaeota archaeon]
MERLIPKIKEIAQKINSTEEKRKRLAGFLKNMGPDFGLIHGLEPDPLKDLKVVGVDGGIAKKSLHGFDCMLVRAAGACFHYKQGKIEKVDYLPSRIPLPKPEIIEALSDMDWAYFTSISRQRLEVKTALDCIDKFKPDFLLMDGSIVPHYSDKPSRSSAVYENYKELISDCK